MSVREEAVKLYNEGLNFAKQERYAEAIQPILKAVEMDPDYVNAHNLLGKIHIQDGDVKRAREYWLQALKIDPYNATATACLEASYPKPLLGGTRNIIRLSTSIIVIGLIIYALFQLQILTNKTEVIEDKTKEIEQIITSIPKQPPSNSNIILPKKPAEDPHTQIAEHQTNVENHRNSVTNATKAKTADQTTKKSKQIPPGITKKPTPEEQKPDIPQTKEDLTKKYKEAQKLRQNRKYKEALATFNALTQTSVSHRYIIGNSYFWMGICYKALGKPVKALESFQKVTAQNSYKAEETKNEIKALQRKMGK